MPRDKLSYDSSLPPFLQRLHEQKAGRGDTDRHEQPIARAKRAKDPNEDDGPTVVDESGETLSKEDYEKLQKSNAGVDDTPNVKGDSDLAAEPRMSGALPEDALQGKHVKVTDGTAQKKRKAAKVVGNDNDPHADGDTISSTQKQSKKPKKKQKTVKLAFNDDDGD
ncbi:hypothetical protein BST61_g221 [Cercospora zeina]